MISAVNRMLDQMKRELFECLKTILKCLTDGLTKLNFENLIKLYIW